MNIKKQVFSGVKWTTISTIFVAVANLIKISVLTRFLNESDFGLMAIVSIVIGFGDMFMDLGLTSAILYKQEIKKNEYSSLYWFNLVFSILVFLVIWIFTPFISSFYNEPELNQLIPLTGVNVIASGLGRQFKTIDQKKMRFQSISIIEILAALASLVLSIILAILGFGIYALVYSVILQLSVSNIIFLLKGTKLEGLLFYFDFRDVKPFLKIGIYRVGGQIVNYFSRDLDILIIGKLFGTEILGGYSLAKQLVRRPLSIVDYVVSRVSNSILPKFQDNKEKLGAHISEILTKLSLVNALVYGLIAIAASSLVHILYGKEYYNIVTIVQIFAPIVFLRSMAGQVGVLVIAKGRTDLEFYWNILTFFVYPLAIYLGSAYQIQGVTIALLITQLIMMVPIWYFFYNKLIGYELIKYLRIICNPLVIGFVAFSFYSFAEDYGIFMQFLSSIILCLMLLAYGYYYDNDVSMVLKKVFK